MTCQGMKKLLFVALLVFMVLSYGINSYAETSSQPATKAPSFSFSQQDGSALPGVGGTGTGTLTPDLFTGTMSYSIPIEIPAGRNGIQPNLALTYSSGNGNGWVGMGWDLDAGAIERNASNGIDYYGNDFVLRMAGKEISLVYDSANSMYRAKVEGDFIKVTASEDNYGNIVSWTATDKAGTQYFYGSTYASRQGSIFKWCLDKVRDVNGNFMSLYYSSWSSGQIYLDHIDYTGNDVVSGAPAAVNTVNFYLEQVNSYSTMYSTNFPVLTNYRLKAIDITNAQTGRVRLYNLNYTTSVSNSSSLLSSVQQYGKDAVVDIDTRPHPPVITITGGTTLPAITVGWYDSQVIFVDKQTISGIAGGLTQAQWSAAGHMVIPGDFNGDGKTDLLVQASTGSSNAFLLIADGNGGFQDAVNINAAPINGYGLTQAQWSYDHHKITAGDFNGDGRTDLLLRAGTSTQGTYLLIADGAGGFQAAVDINADPMDGYGLTPGQWSADNHKIIAGDFNGDGRTDLLLRGGTSSQSTYLLLADGAGGFQTAVNINAAPINGYGLTQAQWSADNHRIIAGDFNGDGHTDLLLQGATGSYDTYLLTACTGGFYNALTISNLFGFTIAQWAANASKIIPGDFNGDGRTDLLLQGISGTHTTFLLLGDGTAGYGAGGFVSGGPVSFGLSQAQWAADACNIISGDFNGDGRTDLLLQGIDGTHNTFLLISDTIFRFQDKQTVSTSYGLTQGQWTADTRKITSGDFNGDGRTDLLLEGATGSNATFMLLSDQTLLNHLQGTGNGIGGQTTVQYKPSTQYANSQLPFPVQTVSSVTTCDNYDNAASPPACVGTSSTTAYQYSGGYYHVGEHDFRGFNHAAVTAPGAQKITETWFHQGNDAAVDANDPAGSVGYMKGKPYRKRVTDGQGHIYYEVTTGYLPRLDDTVPYYFNPAQEVDGSICDGGACTRQTRTVFTYDGYGNVTGEAQYGDLADAGDDRTVTRTFFPNTSAWILNKPANESIYSGVTGTLIKVSSTDYYYDGTTDCNTASSNQTPDKGHQTRIVRWLDGGSNPELRKAYDGYGNPVCTRDSTGNISTVAYDASATFVRTETDPLGHQTITQYYGVDGIAGDKGLYGQVKSVTDPNNAVTVLEYDVLGRKIKMTPPNNSAINWSYNNFGAGVGLQYVKVDTAVGSYASTYFDGAGRTITEKKTGPDSKTIVTQTEYNQTGTIARKTLPYFDQIDPQPWTNFTYDLLGRTLQVVNPDSTRTLLCYNAGVSVQLDAEGHHKRATKDVNGRLVKIEEYLGTQTNCTTDPGTPYATTLYQYDVLGNLLHVIDAEGHSTDMSYDTAGRKTFMHDPDMGDWLYSYDANGNELSQTDANGNTITFTYDALSRPIRKHYPSGVDTVYAYDETSSTNGIGRVTTLSDASGVAAYFYDNQGLLSKTTRTVDGTNYTIENTYDALGRLSSITYPDNEIVNYGYDTGGNLAVVSSVSGTNYIGYTNYNALAQPGTATFGNGVTTTYEYYPGNNRLQNIITKDPASQNLLSLSYGYYDSGNVSAITDNIDNTRTQTFVYDDLSRVQMAQNTVYGTFFYTYGQTGNIMYKEGVTYQYDVNGDFTKPHAVKSTTNGQTYAYDLNGNMTSDGQRTITYNYDNMPETITTVLSGATTTFVYDGNGARVKKIAPTGNSRYIGKLYECNAGACSKYIFANDVRVALKTPAGISYYHQDGLNSSSIITDATGTTLEEIAYYPFGASRSDVGSVSVNHKYTSQEFDAETGLYFYNARYYNPVLGRFISPDTLVQNMDDPQALNRYAYARNNPLRYVDPTGHSFWHNLFDDFFAVWLFEYIQQAAEKEIREHRNSIRRYFNPIAPGLTAKGTLADISGELSRYKDKFEDELRSHRDELRTLLNPLSADVLPGISISLPVPGGRSLNIELPQINLDRYKDKIEKQYKEHREVIRGYVVHMFFDQIAGGYMMQRTEQGRNILAYEIVGSAIVGVCFGVMDPLAVADTAYAGYKAYREDKDILSTVGKTLVKDDLTSSVESALGIDLSSLF